MPPPPDRDLDALVDVGCRLSAVLDQVEKRQLALATPCVGWNLGDLIDHVTGGNRFTIGILGGQPAEGALAETSAGLRRGHASTGDAISSVDEQEMAFHRPGVLGRSWSHVAGELTGRQILRLRLHDLIVHTWDLEQTLHPPASIPAAAVAWGWRELGDRDSLTEQHFELTGAPRPPSTAGAASAYLARFGR